jgi:hypothetical protein
LTEIDLFISPSVENHAAESRQTLLPAQAQTSQSIVISEEPQSDSKPAKNSLKIAKTDCKT